MIERGLAHLGNFAHPYEPQFDVDSEQGQAACKSFLSTAEKIQQILGCRTAYRDYRDNFSKAYKILYKDKQLCYLIEILDSAQECKLSRRPVFVRERREIRILTGGDRARH